MVTHLELAVAFPPRSKVGAPGQRFVPRPGSPSEFRTFLAS